MRVLPCLAKNSTAKKKEPKTVGGGFEPATYVISRRAIRRFFIDGLDHVSYLVVVQVSGYVDLCIRMCPKCVSQFSTFFKTSSINVERLAPHIDQLF
jgi:hypothetical protein